VYTEHRMCTQHSHKEVQLKREGVYVVCKTYISISKVPSQLNHVVVPQPWITMIRSTMQCSLHEYASVCVCKEPNSSVCICFPG
jgi:hypothetical protein